MSHDLNPPRFFGFLPTVPSTEFSTAAMAPLADARGHPATYTLPGTNRLFHLGISKNISKKAVFEGICSLMFRQALWFLSDFGSRLEVQNRKHIFWETQFEGVQAWLTS